MKKVSVLVVAAVVFGAILLTGVCLIMTHIDYAGILSTISIPDSMDTAVLQVIDEDPFADVGLPLGDTMFVAGYYFDGLRLYIKLTGVDKHATFAARDFRLCSGVNEYDAWTFFGERIVGKVLGGGQSYTLLVFNTLEDVDLRDCRLRYHTDTCTASFSMQADTVTHTYPGVTSDGLTLSEVKFARTCTMIRCKAEFLDHATELRFLLDGTNYPVYETGGTNGQHNYLIPVRLTGEAFGTLIVTDDAMQTYNIRMVFT
ncbi:MAG: hypothetical protein IJ766_10760 [Clostridia bacterium]|nr:hypothetical protein [Clostridia bacterium]